jgi:O-antigen ligase
MAIVVGVINYFNEIIEYLVRGQSFEEMLLLTERARFWLILISNTLFDQPILGHGYQMLGDDGITKHFPDLGYSISNAHNTFIQTFVGLGLIGFFLLSYHLLRVVMSLRYV